MTKETYDLMISLGFKFLNYPVRLNDTQPSFLRTKLVGHNLEFIIPFKDAHNFLTYCVDAARYQGEKEGELKGKRELQSKLNELLNG